MRTSKPRPRRRSVLLTRTLLALGALTTVATSSADDPALTAAGHTRLDGADLVHIVAHANADVTVEAESLQVTATLRWTDGAAAVRVIPDDPALGVHTLTATEAGHILTWVYLADSAPGDGDFVCTPGEPCRFGFSVETFETTTEAPSRVTVDVEMTALSTADQRFCFPEDSSFSAGAALEVRVDAAR